MVPQAVLESLDKEQLSIFCFEKLAHELARSGQFGHAAHSYGARIAPPRPFRLELTSLGALYARTDPSAAYGPMFACSFCAGMCVPMRAGRFLYMPEMLPQRGAASGGERRLHGAARSMAAPQAACGRARAPPSGRSRALSIARGASPRADRRSCAPRCARACAGEAAARRGWPPLWSDRSCAPVPCTERRATRVWRICSEVWSRGVVVRLRTFYMHATTCTIRFVRNFHTQPSSRGHAHTSLAPIPPLAVCRLRGS